MQLHPPAGHTLQDVARVVPGLRWHMGTGRRDRVPTLAASPTWQQLSSRDLQQLMAILYTEVRAIPVAVERARLAKLGDPGAWDSHCHRLVAGLVQANGLAATLWSCAPVVLEMLRTLWHTTS